MHCTVAEAKERVDEEEFILLLKLYQVDPWGEERMDLRFAMLGCLIGNAMRAFGGGKGHKFRPEDFMLSRYPKPPMTPEEIKRRFVQFARMHNARIGAGRRG